MFVHRRVVRAPEPRPCSLPAVLPEPDPNSLVYVMHKGFGPSRIDVMTRAEADRKDGLTRKQNRK